MRRIIIFSKKAESSQVYERILSKVYDNHYLRTFDDIPNLLKFLKLNTVHYVIIDNCFELNQFFVKMKKSYPNTRLILISDKVNTDCIDLSIKHNAAAVILDSQIENDINNAIEEIEVGNPFFSDELAPNILSKITKNRFNSYNNSSLEILTKRETEVLTLILEELTNYEIAKKLFISPRTVDTHRRNLLQKTNSKNTVGLVKFAFKNNIINLA